MRRREWAGLVIVTLELALAAGCGLDNYLTCGTPCEDASVTFDATMSKDSGNGYDSGKYYDSGNNQDSSYVKDSGYDASQQQDGGDASNCTNQYCQGSSSCCTAAPVCNSGNRCAASCGAVDASCTTQPDTCCQQAYCSNGHCKQCLGNDAGCQYDNQCCSGSCSNSNVCQ